jgi:hypothetical protein
VTDKKSPHENLAERTFGLVIAVIFIIVALFPLLAMSSQDGTMHMWALIVAAFFTVTSLTMPILLTPLTKLWFKLCLLVRNILNP